jgi:hypothetical protein
MVMIFFDIAGFAGSIAVIAQLFSMAIGSNPFLTPEEAFAASLFSALGIRLTMQWFQLRLGRFVRIKPHRRTADSSARG